jgi:hypothetical protein
MVHPQSCSLAAQVGAVLDAKQKVAASPTGIYSIYEHVHSTQLARLTRYVRAGSNNYPSVAAPVQPSFYSAPQQQQSRDSSQYSRDSSQYSRGRDQQGAAVYRDELGVQYGMGTGTSASGMHPHRSGSQSVLSEFASVLAVARSIWYIYHMGQGLVGGYIYHMGYIHKLLMMVTQRCQA